MFRHILKAFSIASPVRDSRDAMEIFRRLISVPRTQRGQVNGATGFDFGQVPSIAQLAQYGVLSPDKVEAVRQPLYDRLLYPAAGIAGLRFFQLPQGQGLTTAIGSAGAGVKTLDDTNMESAGQLPSPKAFLATSIEIIVDAGASPTANVFTPANVAFLGSSTKVTIGDVPEMNAANDVQHMLMSAWLDLFISAKSYLQAARLDTFPPKSYTAVDAAVAASAATAGIAAARAVGQPFYINPPVLLLPNTNFVVSLNWPNLVPTLTTNNARIAVRLDGFLYRNAQ